MNSVKPFYIQTIYNTPFLYKQGIAIVCLHNNNTTQQLSDISELMQIERGYLTLPPILIHKSYLCKLGGGTVHHTVL